MSGHQKFETGEERFEKRVLEKYPDAKVLTVFPVLWIAWECDPYAAVIQRGDGPHLITTDHGSLYEVADPKGWFVRQLEEYTDVMAKTAAAEVLTRDQ